MNLSRFQLSIIAAGAVFLGCLTGLGLVAAVLYDLYTFDPNAVALGITFGIPLVFAMAPLSVGIASWWTLRRQEEDIPGSVLIAVGFGLFDVLLSLSGMAFFIFRFLTYSAPSNVIIGRPPEGPRPKLDAKGPWADMARDEYASVGTFARLACELAHHGAPRALEDACLRAAQEELDHARFALSKLEGTFGPWCPPRRDPPTRRALGWESFVEGAIAEGLGSIVARYRGRPDHIDGASWSKLAHEEEGHARISFVIAVWSVLGASGPARRSAGGEQVLHALQTATAMG